MLVPDPIPASGKDPMRSTTPTPATRRAGQARPARSLAAALTALVATAVLLVVGTTAAAAHVDAEANDVTPDGFTRIVLSFHHGCEGQPTTALRVRLPEGATDVAAEDVEGFTAEVADGEVRWSGGSVPDGTEAEFAFSARLAQPDGTEVPVPTIQECPDGENAWIEPPTDDESEASSPAPVIVVPVGGGGQATPTVETTTSTADSTTTTVDADRPAAAAVAAAPEDESALGGGAVGFMVFAGVMVAVAGGAVYLVIRSRKA